MLIIGNGSYLYHLCVSGRCTRRGFMRLPSWPHHRRFANKNKMFVPQDTLSASQIVMWRFHYYGQFVTGGRMATASSLQADTYGRMIRTLNWMKENISVVHFYSRDYQNDHQRRDKASAITSWAKHKTLTKWDLEEAIVPSLSIRASSGVGTQDCITISSCVGPRVQIVIPLL